MIRASVLALLAAFALMSVSMPGSARAQSRDENVRNCDQEDNPDLSITSCTAQIQSGQETNGNLASEYNNRGGAYEKKKQYDLALADLNQAIRLDPTLTAAFNNRGAMYDHKGQYDAAFADYDHAIQLDPTAPEALRNRASLHRKKGEYDLSIADATEAIRLKPNYADVFYVRGDAYNDTEQYKLAIADYAEDIRLRPDHADGWNSRCWTRAIVGELVQALNDCNQSLILRPSDAESLDSRGFLYLKLGRLDLATIDYSAALALKPKQAESLFGRGLAERKSNPAKAKADIIAALTIKPQVIAEFRRWGVSQPLPAGVPPDLTVPGTFSAETLKALDDQPAYRTLSGLYDMNKDNAVWQQSEQGQAVIAVLQLMRDDAEAIGSAAGMFQYSIGGVKVTDEGISLADLVVSPSYRHTMADAVASNICASKPVQAFLSKLSSR
jgi:tetratricopeptide (TPR) repeat protein